MHRYHGSFYFFHLNSLEGHCTTSWKVEASIRLGFFIHLNLPAFNRNEYREYFLWGKAGRCVGLTTLLLSCVDCLEIWEPQTPATLRTCPRL